MFRLDRGKIRQVKLQIRLFQRVLHLIIVFHNIHNGQAANGSMVARFKKERAMKILLSIVLLLPLPVIAQDAGNDPDPTAKICSSREHRQFDFWIGDWNVTSNEQPAGTNSIQSIHNGCALQENWQGAGPGGISGTSFNIYDKATGQWHQTWVDSSGTLLLLNGAFVDGAMVMSGTRPARDGTGTALHRISWTPNPDGTVRQLWEASSDGGSNWAVLFDGLYTRQNSDL